MVTARICEILQFERHRKTEEAVANAEVQLTSE